MRDANKRNVSNAKCFIQQLGILELVTTA